MKNLLRLVAVCSLMVGLCAHAETNIVVLENANYLTRSADGTTVFSHPSIDDYYISYPKMFGRQSIADRFCQLAGFEYSTDYDGTVHHGRGVRLISDKMGRPTIGNLSRSIGSFTSISCR